MAEIANQELCKELYELSGWTVLGFADGWHSGNGSPAYDLGYLLRKLEDSGETIILRYNNPENMTAIALSDWNKQYTAATVSMTQGSYPIASTPEDAACKLAIELFKQGVLK